MTDSTAKSPVDASALAVAAERLAESAAGTKDTEGLLRDIGSLAASAEAYLADIEDSISAG